MKFDVLEEKDNPVMKRKEFVLSLDYGLGSTPSKAELQNAVASNMKASADSVEITKITSEVGKAFGKAWVKIWQEKKIAPYKAKKGEAATDEHVEEKSSNAEVATDEHVEEKAPEEEKKGEQ